MTETQSPPRRPRSVMLARVERARYRIVVEGELGPRFATVFEGMRMEHLEGNTVIVGDVVDQAHLQGLLDQLPRFGLKLVGVARGD